MRPVIQLELQSKPVPRTRSIKPPTKKGKRSSTINQQKPYATSKPPPTRNSNRAKPTHHRLFFNHGSFVPRPFPVASRGSLMGYATATEVVKSPTDRRLYRILHLPNGLCSLLVHDPEIFPDGPPEASSTHHGEDDDDEDDCDGEEEEEEEEEDDDVEEEEEEEEEEGGGVQKKQKRCGETPTKKAAAAVCVGMGSFLDPSNAQGLAHFLEHMLFMGSSKFPDENEYDRYLSEHGGSSNAYTDAEHTCYHFEVNREYLKGALERFSQFFISPLVKSEAMEREVLAVDSEFNQSLQNDSCRLQQLQCCTSPVDHPYNRFSWGNKKSLSDAVERGVNLREEILQMYEQNYLGGKIKVVVIGGEPLDILESWVVELFGNVKKGPCQSLCDGTDVDGQGDLIPIWKGGKMYRVEAVKDVHILELTWTLPCLHKEYLKKPEDYLAHLLGHEGRGSLLFFLKSKGWASLLSAGVGNEGMSQSSVAYIFVMCIYLTDSGLEKLYEVVAAVYQYIRLLRQSTPQEWVFKELQDIGNIEFRFAEEQPQDEYAARLAENLLYYSEEHIIYGEYAFEVWDAELVKHILGYFTPDNMRVDLLSRSFNGQLPGIRYEPWFGAQYTEEDVPLPIMDLWRNPPEIDSSLHFPVKNDFIPHDFSLRNASLPSNHEKAELPKCILDLPKLKFWYKLDSTFNVPRASTRFLISLKEAYDSVRNCVLTELFLNLLKDELNDVLYQAGVAKLETSLSVVCDKVELKIYGFNEKLPALLSTILSLSGSFVPKADRFLVIKEDMKRGFRNTNMKPLRHSTYLRLQALREKFWDVDAKLSCLVNLSIGDLEAFVPQLLSQMYIEGLCHGNLSEQEAINLSNIFTTIFPVQPLPVEMRHHEHVLCLPSCAHMVRSVPVKNESEVNSVLELYFQIEQDVGTTSTRLRAITDLFSSIVEEPCFNQLRTKEQLGYAVESGPRMTYGVLGFCFRVQSSEYNPLHLHERINSFIGSLQEFMDGLDDVRFENHKIGLIEEKLEKDPSLSYETDRYWNQIVDKRYLFDVHKLEAEELKTIRKGDVIAWYNTYLRPPSSRCRQLAIHLWGCNAKKDELEKTAKFGKLIEDISSMKLSSEFYDSLC